MRLDSGVEEGDAVDGRFDSMIAKLVVTGRDRFEALRRARRALAEARIEGVPTTLAFYREVVEHPDFTAVDGRFAAHNRGIEQEAAGLLEPEPAVDDLLTVRLGRRLTVVPAPGVAALGERAAPIRRESAALRLAGRRASRRRRDRAHAGHDRARRGLRRTGDRPGELSPCWRR